MHGEYKVPGGKLIVADIQEQDGIITKVQISGDFFLEPEEVLGDMTDAIIGLSVNSSAKEMISATKKVIPEGALLLGITPEAIAITVRRALGAAKTWRDFEWQIIDGRGMSPLMNVALDEVLAKEVVAGNRMPTLRFWEWTSSAVIIGSFQSVKNEVDQEAAKALGIDIVRRATGGGAMFVEKGTTITYSLYVPIELVEDMNHVDSYAFLDNWVLKALNKLGIEATYKPINDITSPKGKIGGAAQKRFSNKAVLHHVTMAYDMDANKMMQVLRVGREKLSDKGITSAAKRVDPVRSQTGMTREDVIATLKTVFIDLNGGVDGSITDDEFAAAEQLIIDKYSTEQWSQKLP